MFNQSVDNYLDSLKNVPECFKTQDMCDKVANIHSPVIQVVIECFKLQEICV